MTIKPPYTPYRILKPFCKVGTRAELKLNFPSGVIKGHGTITGAFWKPQQVVNTPTLKEKALFDLLPDEVVVMIPQDPRGFDDRRSPVARDVRNSAKAKKDAEVELAKRTWAQRPMVENIKSETEEES
jgi:hypothetical protein